MLDIAIKYEEQLQKLFCDISFDEKYKFLYGSSYRDKYVADTTTWNKHEFVSIKNGNVMGYLKYNIDRDSNIAWGVQIVNFYEPNIIFSKDLKQFLTDIFDKFKFRKLKFCCFIGNPIEKMYDKYIAKYGGRIVGIYEEDSKLIDGNYYDLKEYEVFLKDYLKTLKRKNTSESYIDYKTSSKSIVGSYLTGDTNKDLIIYSPQNININNETDIDKITHEIVEKLKHTSSNM